MKNLIAQIGILIGAWLTFLTTFKDFVELTNFLPFYLCELKEGWIIFWYFIGIMFCGFIGMMLNQKLVEEDEVRSESKAVLDGAGDYDNLLSKSLKRILLLEKLKLISTLGFFWIVEKILSDYFGVLYIDEFNKPNYWESFPDDHDPEKIIRATIKSIRTEIRFKKSEFKVLYRQTLENSSTFGEFNISDFTFREYGFLFLICPFYLIKKFIKINLIKFLKLFDA